MNLNGSDIQGIWTNSNNTRLGYETRKLYYDGQQVVNDLFNTTRLDGRLKTNAVTNWIAYVVDQHTGFLLKNGVGYSDTNDVEALSNFNSIYKNNNLKSTDYSNLLNAILYGVGVEVVTVGDGGEITVDGTDPRSWAFAYDAKGSVAVAVYRASLPAYTVYQGQLLASPKILYYVWTDTVKQIYEQGKNAPALVSESPNLLGRIPVVIYRAKNDKQSHISDAIITANDLYDVVRCSLADDLKYNVDSFLAVKGIKLEQLLMKKSDTGPTILEQMKQMGIWAVPEGASLDFMSRNVDIEKFKYDLRTSRLTIHLMGAVPDVSLRDDTTSVTSNVSGVALKILYQSMIQKASEFKVNFISGLQDRINLINHVWTIQNKKQLNDCEITITANVPQNDIEYMQYIGGLAGVVSVKDKLKLLPMVEDPEKAYQNLLDENKLDTNTESVITYNDNEPIN